MSPHVGSGALAEEAQSSLADTQAKARNTQNAIEAQNAKNIEAFTPPTSIESQGNTVQAGLTAQHAAERERVSNNYFNMIDPTGTVTHTTAPAKQMANILLGNTPIQLPPNATPAMVNYANSLREFQINPRLETTTHPEELQQLELVARMPDRISYQDTKTLLRNISEAQQTVRGNNGYGSRSLTRLGMLRQSLIDSVQPDLPQRIQQERAAPPNLEDMPFEEAMAHYVTRQTAPPDQPTVERLYAPPEMPSAQAQSIREANNQWRQVEQRYTQGAVGDITARDENNNYKMHDLANVMTTAVGGGKAAPQRMAEVVSAANQNPEIMRAIHDFLLGHVRDKLLTKAGAVDVAKYDSMVAKDDPLLRVINMFPPIRQRLGSAAAIQRELDTNNTNAAFALEKFRGSQLAKSLGDLETRTPGGPLMPKGDPLYNVKLHVRKAINSNDANKLLQMADEVRGNPHALESLKDTVIEQMVDEFAPMSRAEAGMQRALIDRNAFRDFLSSHKPALIRIFGGQGFQHFDRVAASLQDAERARTAKAAPTTTPLKMWSLIASLGNHGGAGILGGLGAGMLDAGAEGGLSLHTLGAMASGAVALGTFKHLQEAGIKTSADLIGALMRYPAFYREMERAYPVRPGSLQMMGRRLEGAARAITAAQLAGTLPHGAPNQKQGQ